MTVDCGMPPLGIWNRRVQDLPSVFTGNRALEVTTSMRRQMPRLRLQLIDCSLETGVFKRYSVKLSNHREPLLS